ncbi:hypothetical protein BGW38_010091, partial [Lunasporangiospora selenospora]
PFYYSSSSKHYRAFPMAPHMRPVRDPCRAGVEVGPSEHMHEPPETEELSPSYADIHQHRRVNAPSLIDDLAPPPPIGPDDMHEDMEAPLYTFQATAAQDIAVVASPLPPLLPLMSQEALPPGLLPPPPLSCEIDATESVDQGDDGSDQEEQEEPPLKTKPHDDVPATFITPSGLCASLELESDTIEIYDRSNEGFL